MGIFLGQGPEAGNNNNNQDDGDDDYCQIVAWRIPWTEEPGGLQPMGSQRVRHDCETNIFFFHGMLNMGQASRYMLYMHVLIHPSHNSSASR